MVDEILTFDETRKYLKISRSKLYLFAQQNKIPVSKIGRTWRFKKSKIDAWLEKQEQNIQYVT
jgi:excisionase family DNA binding protein